MIDEEEERSAFPCLNQQRSLLQVNTNHALRVSARNHASSRSHLASSTNKEAIDPVDDGIINKQKLQSFLVFKRVKRVGRGESIEVEWADGSYSWEAKKKLQEDMLPDTFEELYAMAIRDEDDANTTATKTCAQQQHKKTIALGKRVTRTTTTTTESTTEEKVIKD